MVVGGKARLSGQAAGLTAGAAGLAGLADGRSVLAEGWMIGVGGSWVLSCVGWGLGIPSVEGGAAIGPLEGFAGGGLAGAGSERTVGLGGGGSLETCWRSSSTVR